MGTKIDICEKCGRFWTIGDWPWCPHGKPIPIHPFKPYFDEHISPEGAYLTSHYQRNKIMRQNDADYRPVGQGNPNCEI